MKNTITLLLVLILLASLLICVSSCKKKTEPVLRIGTNAEYPPFEYKEGDKFVGVDMDLAVKLAEKLDLKYEITDMDFDALIPSLTNDKIDLALSAITITDERKQQVDFSLPYYVANQVIIGKLDNKTEITKLEDIAKLKVGAQNGTTGQIYLDSMLVKPNIMKKDNLRKYSTNIEAITDMLNGNIDYVIIDDSAAQGYAKLKPIKIMYKIETNENYGIAMQKNSPYKDKINTALSEMMSSGELLTIIQNYFK